MPTGLRHFPTEGGVQNYHRLSFLCSSKLQNSANFSIYLILTKALFILEPVAAIAYSYTCYCRNSTGNYRLICLNSYCYRHFLVQSYNRVKFPGLVQIKTQRQCTVIKNDLYQHGKYIISNITINIILYRNLRFYLTYNLNSPNVNNNSISFIFTRLFLDNIFLNVQ
jgi:hypothetical protein